MTKRSYWISVCAFLAVVLLTIPGSLAQNTVRSDNSLDTLVFNITPERMSRLLTEAGYAIERRDTDSWTIVSPSNQTLHLLLLGCEGTGCDAIRLRGMWALGNRSAAISAARFYEETVPIAFVSFRPVNDGLVLFAGRDVVLTPGRTLRNLLFQVHQVDRMTTRISDMLVEKDPGILDHWQQIREAGDG